MVLVIYFTLALAAFIYLAAAYISGHGDIDHDVDHDADHDHDHDADHGHGFLGGFFGRLFSPKVVASFVMVFGAVGGIARYKGASVLSSGIYGVLGGVAIAAVMSALFTLLYKQQADSLKKTFLLRGKSGMVEVPIPESGYGEVVVEGQQYLAESSDGKPISKGTQVKVVNTAGSTLIVQEKT